MGLSSNKIFALAFISGLMSAAFAAPAAATVEYVKVCSLYGAGFYYVPGSDTCLRIGGFVQGGFVAGQSDFDVMPSLNLNSQGWSVGAGGQALFYTPNGFVFGVEGSWNKADVSDSTIWAGNSLLHSYKLRSYYDVLGIAGIQLPRTTNTPNIAPPSLSLVVGERWGEARVSGGAFTDNHSISGLAIGALWDQPVSPHCSFGIEVTYTNYGRNNFNLGGPVIVDQNNWSAIIRLQRNFSTQ